MLCIYFLNRLSAEKTAVDDVFFFKLNTYGDIYTQFSG